MGSTRTAASHRASRPVRFQSLRQAGCLRTQPAVAYGLVAFERRGQAAVGDPGRWANAKKRRADR